MNQIGKERKKFRAAIELMACVLGLLGDDLRELSLAAKAAIKNKRNHSR